MRIFFAALNSSYSHSCPAVFALKNSVNKAGFDVSWGEWTINTPRRQVLAALFKAQADIISFSVYIWNVEYIIKLAIELKQMLPDIKIVFGGPQAIGEREALLKSCPAADCLCLGEGEGLLPRLLKAWAKGAEKPEIPGFLWQGEEKGEIPPKEDFASLPFLYTGEDLKELSGHILYYESSRGCPHNCAFCASAGEPLRLRPINTVKKELKILADSGAGQIKFVDRTFNADPKRGREIINFLLDLYRPGLSWHFEISPYILPPDLRDIFAEAPAGYFRLEAGIQSLNPQTLKAISRGGNWAKAEENIKALIKKDNLHLHLDLIAGLPHESPASFAQAFNRLHNLAPHYLQLGFLKILPGSPLAKKANELGLIYSPFPPYQIISTPDLSAGELIKLGKAEEMADAFYNSGGFRQSLFAFGRLWPGGALDFYLSLAKAKKTRGSLALREKIKMLWGFCEFLKEKDFLRDVLLFDCLYYNLKAPLPQEMQKNIQGESIRIDHYPILAGGGLFKWGNLPVKLRFGKNKVPAASGGREFFRESE